MSCARRKTMKRFPLSSPLPRVSSAWERVRVRELKQVRIFEGATPPDFWTQSRRTP